MQWGAQRCGGCRALLAPGADADLQSRLPRNEPWRGNGPSSAGRCVCLAWEGSRGGCSSENLVAACPAVVTTVALQVPARSPELSPC